MTYKSIASPSMLLYNVSVWLVRNCVINTMIMASMRPPGWGIWNTINSYWQGYRKWEATSLVVWCLPWLWETWVWFSARPKSFLSSVDKLKIVGDQKREIYICHSTKCLVEQKVWDVKHKTWGMKSEKYGVLYVKVCDTLPHYPLKSYLSSSHQANV